MKEIKISTNYIKLGQFLKIIGKIESGGKAKEYLENNDCFLNNIKEIKRGKKLFNGDIIKINNKTYKIIEEQNKNDF